MALNDPRQRARLGAACALGYYAGLARAGVEAVVFGGTTGPFGVVHTAQPWPTPGFDREGDPYPIFFALQSLAALRGANLRALHLSEPGVIDGLAADRGDGVDMVLANLTAHAKQIQFGARVETIEPFGLLVRSFGAKELANERA